MPRRPLMWVAIVVARAMLAACANESRTPARRSVASTAKRGSHTGTSGPSSPPRSDADPTSFATQSPAIRGRERLVVEAVYTPVCGPAGPTPSTDPSCGPKKLDGVMITVRDRAGTTVAERATDARGTSTFPLAPGEYEVTGAPDPRAHITPNPQRVTIGAATTVTLRLRYASAFQ